MSNRLMKDSNLPPEEERSAADFLPSKRTLPCLKKAAEHCKGCDLYLHATQTVFGGGPEKARVVFVGEQPGDIEDKEGEPFVGPAGKLLDKALEEAEIARGDVYLTNAVKHFKFEWRGKRRLHKKPRQIEIDACFPWLEEEISAIKPDVIVCLGATAAQALLGKKFKVTKQRGQFFKYSLAPYIVATVHPSSILRAPDAEARHQEMTMFIRDLKGVATFLKRGKVPIIDDLAS